MVIYVAAEGKVRYITVFGLYLKQSHRFLFPLPLSGHRILSKMDISSVNVLFGTKKKKKIEIVRKVFPDNTPPPKVLKEEVYITRHDNVV